MIHVRREEQALSENRHRILRNLNELDRTLHAFNESDAVSRACFVWSREMRQEADSAQFSLAAKDRLISQLKGLLQDSLSCQTDHEEPVSPPLDEEALLGSDGCVYGKRLLAIFLSRQPESHRRNSPNRANEPLWVQPHLPARCLVEWLKREENYVTQPEIDQLYLELFRRRAPFLPMREDAATTRRKLRAECLAMNHCAASIRDEAMKNHTLHRELSGWIAELERTLNAPEIEGTAWQQLIASLKAHLAGLGDQPYFGTDHKIYGEMDLAIRVSDPQHEWRHTAIPHPLARHLIDWLWSKGYSVEEPQDIRDRYHALQQSDLLRPIPMPMSEQAERFQRIVRERNARRALLAQQELAPILAPLQEVRQHVQNVNVEVDQRIREGNAALQQELRRLEAVLVQLRRRNEELRREIQRTGGSLTNTERGIQEAELRCNEIAQKQAESSRDGIISIIGAAGCIALSVALKVPVQWVPP